MKHVLHGPSDHKNDWESDSCQSCVLSLCKVCGGAESSMPTDCPGRQMTEDEDNNITLGHLDFVNGEWIDSRPLNQRATGAGVTAAQKGASLTGLPQPEGCSRPQLKPGQLVTHQDGRITCHDCTDKQGCLDVDRCKWHNSELGS